MGKAENAETCYAWHKYENATATHQLRRATKCGIMQKSCAAVLSMLEKLRIAHGGYKVRHLQQCWNEWWIAKLANAVDSAMRAQR